MKGLSNYYVQNLVSNYNINKFRGVFSADNFPLGGTGKFIINTHPSTKKGEHFIVLVREKRKFIFFDPLGLTLDSYPYVKKRIEQSKHPKKYHLYLKGPVQSPLSSFCGFFCVLFLLIYDLKSSQKLKSLIPFDKNNLLLNDEICISNLEILTKMK